MRLPHMNNLRQRARTRALCAVAVLGTVSVTIAVPVQASQAASPGPGAVSVAPAVQTTHQAVTKKPDRKKKAGKKNTGKKASKKPVRPVGKPRANLTPPPGSVFSYPNRSTKERFAIRRKVLHTIRSVWGGPRDRLRAAAPGNGRIRIATWSFNDKTIARALYKAHRRGVSVQVVAAAGANKHHDAWHWLRKKLHSRLHAKGHPETTDRWSFARKCRGACRGHGGTAHAKYFLFRNVGSAHIPRITMQTSTNLTRNAYQHQWNQATITWGRPVYRAFAAVFGEARRVKPVRHPFRWFNAGGVINIFFPRLRAKPHEDPIMQILKPVRCKGAASGRTRIRVVQYAMYETRGNWIAKRLRQLWNRGCDVRIIYAIASRPVLMTLRSRAGRGPIPMRQSVIRNRYGELAYYNHSKWMTITGAYGGSPAMSLVVPGSPNWGNLALSSDEQMQLLGGPFWVRPYLKSFKKTWKQRTSRPPETFGFGMRLLPPGFGEPEFGEGELRLLPED